MVGGWRNPYPTASVHHDTAWENFQRVQRTKVEDEFFRLQPLKQHYTLEEFQSFVVERERDQSKQQHSRGKSRGRLPSPTARTSHSSPIRRASPPNRSSRRHELSAIDEFHPRGTPVTRVQTTLGGTGIWTIDPSGTVSLRSGLSWDVIHSFHSALQARCMVPTRTHMWVGFGDGTIRVYDSTLYMLAAELRVHNSAITSLVVQPGPRATVFSADQDAIVLKWAAEPGGFDLLAKLVTGHYEPITVLACTTDTIFTGSTDTTIGCLHADTADQTGVLQGHSRSITVLAVHGRWLFSGSEDQSIIVWDIPTRHCLQTLGSTHTQDCHSASVTSIMVAGGGSTLWTADAEGRMRVWDLRPSKGFRLLHKVNDGMAGGVVQLVPASVRDTATIWTAGSNGAVFVWNAAAESSVAALQDCLENMRSVLLQDREAFRRWEDLLSRLDTVDHSRDYDVAQALQNSHFVMFAKRYFHKWQRWSTSRKAQSSKTDRAHALSVLASSVSRAHLRWRFRCMVAFVHARRKSYAKADRMQFLRTSTTRGLLLVYFQKLMMHGFRQKAIRKRQVVARGLAQGTSLALLRRYYRKLLQFSFSAPHRTATLELCGQIISSHNTVAANRAYLTWVQKRRVEAVAPRKRHTAAVLRQANTVCGLQPLWRNWISWTQLRRKHRDGAVRLERANQHVLLRRSYFALMDFTFSRRPERLVRELSVVEVTYDELRESVSGLEDALRLRAAVSNCAEDLDQVERDVCALILRNDQLNQSLVVDRALADSRNTPWTVEGLRPHAENTMALLKAEVLSLDTDLRLIGEVHKKSRTKHISKIFLEAHAVVKRIVVDVTRRAQQFGEEWHISLEEINRIPVHHLNSCLQAIKLMVIAFDGMDVATRETIRTDEEIVANALWLLEIALRAQHHLRITHRIPFN